MTLITTGTADTQIRLAWRVPDLKAGLADLRSRGIRNRAVRRARPETFDGIADLGFAWTAWITDPSRNVLGIIQPK